MAGAGPTGLVCALALAKQGVPVIVCEAAPGLAQDQRAGSFHPPTLEMMAPYGITARMLEAGIKVRRWQIRDRTGEHVAEFDLGMLAGDTAYPHRLHLEQHRVTPMILDILRDETGAQVHFGHAVTAIEPFAGGVRARIESGGDSAVAEASWLVAADGGRSTVRKALGLEFEGFTWPEQFLVAGTPYDFAPYGFAMNTYISDPVEWVALFKMPNSGPPGVWRVVFPTAFEADDSALAPDKVEAKMQGFVARPARYEIRYQGVYRVHQRVCKTFRAGRVLLAGDAAHINNPMGAFGLNSGIHDAVNLAEKLGRVWRGEADEALLDRYVRQRRAAAIEHVQAMSIRNLRLLEERDARVQRARLRELAAIAGDPARARRHLLDTSMISSVRQTAEIP